MSPSRSHGKRASRTRTAGTLVSKCLRAPGRVHTGRRMEVVHGLRETASKQRCCTRLTCRSLTAVCARLTLRARAPMLVAHRRRREKMAPDMCAPMAVRSSPCDPSSCTDLISSQTTFYLSQTRAESLVLTWSVFSTGGGTPHLSDRTACRASRPPAAAPRPAVVRWTGRTCVNAESS